MTMKPELKNRSKFLSYILRHHPEELDLEMSRAGWVSVDKLLDGLQERDSDWSTALLYYGTIPRFLAAILAEGLEPGNRHHVHLSHNVQTAIHVGKRRGKPIVLVVEAQQMWDCGHKFYCTPNNVWLVEHVPPDFLRTDSSAAAQAAAPR